MQHNTQRIYLDLEYCYPGMTPERGRPGSDELRQIVQIAAIRYEHQPGQRSGRELDSFDMLTTPAYTRPLPDFFVDLTSITQEQVDSHGRPFIEALAMLVDFCGMTPVYVFDKDWEVVQQNCGYYDAAFPFQDQPFQRVKALLPGWGVPPDTYSSGTLYQAVGLQMDGHVHNALHDVRSMAAAVQILDYSSSDNKLRR